MTFAPMRFSFATSPMLAIPLMIEQKISGITIIWISFKKRSPTGCTNRIFSWKRSPSTAPRPKPKKTFALMESFFIEYHTLLPNQGNAND